MDAEMTQAQETRPSWVVFSYSLPQGNRASLRVSFWRRLRRIGALSPKVGVHVLPWSDDNVEAFDWMSQEAKHAGGDALVMHVERFEGLPDQALVDAFNQQRAEAYAELEPDIAALERDVQAASDDPRQYRTLHEPLMRLRRRLEEIRAIDFFNSALGERLATQLQTLQGRLRPPKLEDPMIASRDEYLGRTWVTRPRPFIDRLACAWFIRRFVDENARIRYGTDVAADEITFDMPDATFGHRGDDCSFETLMKVFDINDPAVSRIAQIVHAIDLRDERFDAPEALGVEAVLRGWQRSDLADEEMERRGLTLFDALCETFRTVTKT
jgi:hypothetical protein